MAIKVRVTCLKVHFLLHFFAVNFSNLSLGYSCLLLLWL
jgi:hypothetical protein